MDKVKISVLMSTYNRVSYVSDSIESITKQSLEELELLIIDDGSNDGTYDTLIELQKKDERIKIFRNSKNSRNLAANLNKLIEKAKGDFIARMDDDEIAHKDRLKFQCEFLDKNHDIDICGTWAKNIGFKNNTNSTPVTNDAIIAKLVVGCPLVHPSVMIRSEFIKKHNVRYDEEFMTAQDFELWSRCYWKYGARFANIPKRLIYYRYHDGNVSSRRSSEQNHYRRKIIRENLRKIGISDDTDLRVLSGECGNILKTKLDIEIIKQFVVRMKTLFPKYGNKVAISHVLKIFKKNNVKCLGFNKINILMIWYKTNKILLKFR